VAPQGSGLNSRSQALATKRVTGEEFSLLQDFDLAKMKLSCNIKVIGRNWNLKKIRSRTIRNKHPAKINRRRRRSGRRREMETNLNLFPVAAFIMSQNGKLRFVNDEFLTMFGATQPRQIVSNVNSIDFFQYSPDFGKFQRSMNSAVDVFQDFRTVLKTPDVLRSKNVPGVDQHLSTSDINGLPVLITARKIATKREMRYVGFIRPYNESLKLLNQLSDDWLLISRDSNVHACSKGGLRLLGLNDATVREIKSLSELVRNSEHKRFKDFLERAKKGETDEHFWGTFLCADGSWLPIRIKALAERRPTPDGGVEVSGVYLLLRERTKFKSRTILEKGASKAPTQLVLIDDFDFFYNEASRRSSFACALKRVEGEQHLVMECNEAFAGLHNMVKLDVIGQLDTTLVTHEDCQAAFHEADRKALSGDIGNVVEAIEWNKKGSRETIFHVLKKKISANELKVVMWQVDSRESEQHFADINSYARFFETSDIGMFVTQSDGRFLNATDSLAKMLGYVNREELLQCLKSTAQLYENAVEHDRRMNDLKNTGRAFSKTTYCCKSTPKSRAIPVLEQSWLSNDGQLIEGVVFSHNRQEEVIDLCQSGLNFLRELVFVHNYEGVILATNKAIRERFFNNDDPSGSNLDIFLGEQSKAIIRRLIKWSSTNDQNRIRAKPHWPIIQFRVNSREYWMEFSSHKIALPPGKPIFLVTGRDVQEVRSQVLNEMKAFTHGTCRIVGHDIKNVIESLMLGFEELVENLEDGLCDKSTIDQLKGSQMKAKAKAVAIFERVRNGADTTESTIEELVAEVKNMLLDKHHIAPIYNLPSDLLSVKISTRFLYAVHLLQNAMQNAVKRENNDRVGGRPEFNLRKLTYPGTSELHVCFEFINYVSADRVDEVQRKLHKVLRDRKRGEADHDGLTIIRDFAEYLDWKQRVEIDKSSGKVSLNIFVPIPKTH